MTSDSTTRQEAGITRRLHQLKGDVSFFSDIRRGIEKETVRTDQQGALTQKAHPKALGSPLTHPHITTDFAEGQIEFVTPAFRQSSEALGFLQNLHGFAAGHIADGEMLWGASMPPVLPDESQIKLAHYGSSNAGKLKTLYRTGLANRYGKAMQTISGIHYNFSLPDSFWEELHKAENSTLSFDDFKSEGYFGQIRNVLRHGWMISYLFGSSPAVDKSFVAGRNHHLQSLDSETLYLPWATSLRMSDLGYTSSAQSSLNIRYNSREEYLADLHYALSLQSEEYSQLDASQQINSSVLQLENELYGSIRPKRIHDSLRPLHALCEQGVEYIELRSLDIDPYLPLGLDQNTSHFLDMFLIYCALSSSPDISAHEQSLISRRQTLVAEEGRRPGLKLPMCSGDQSLSSVGSQVIDEMRPLAELLDKANSTDDFSTALEAQSEKLLNTGLTPSARLLADLRQPQRSYRDLIMELSREHMGLFRNTHIDKELQDRLEQMVSTSIARQKQIEAQDSMSFEEFVAAKNKDIKCCCEHVAIQEAC
ncbi:glutamate--cysteine ligase [Sansalvadorimonas sp. 2012CJ34-2]|uniref:Glutamate--cysteine ligase n=1 Tax=Parendozoicomonas callyspongiae TaxID=2942213 RepID=A0ABT0PGZ6_9GAMM|nr:glutamate--cysteine ligase [Sansalvadorimonas sp. 2012CJ34-2]MCL6270645.1 glutamate--cysteine ligase [Sansalvadorimonas sp. 2012CJ34-2]